MEIDLSFDSSIPTYHGITAFMIDENVGNETEPHENITNNWWNNISESRKHSIRIFGLFILWIVLEMSALIITCPFLHIL